MKNIKNMFNIRLYIEGLKKLKVIGIAASILVIGISALIPVIYMISESDNFYDGSRQIYDVKITEFSIPLVIILAFAPFFVSSILSFMNHRNESDFYHSIPYKRACVFNSFMLSAFTWVLSIIVASVAICGILWGIAPNVSYDISFLPLIVIATFSACLILMCFMALSMSLTGTAMSNLFIFGLLSCFVRVTCVMISYTVDEVAPIWRAGDTFGMLIEPQFFFPITLFGGAVGVFEAAEVYSNLPLYFYTVTVSIALYILAAYMYAKRRSEMAGKSAPSARLQHVYRIAFTTPFVLLLSSFIAMEALSARYYSEIEVLIILAVLAVFVYYLYELITTRQPKNLLKATPYLGILVLIAAVYVVGIGCVKNVVLSNTPEPDEIEYVVFEEENQNYMRKKTYEDLKCENTQIKDSKVIEGVSDSLKFSVEKVKEGTWSRTHEEKDITVYETDMGYDKYVYDMDRKTYEFTTVMIKLKNGQSIKRRIKMYSEDYTALMRAAKDTEEYGDAYLAIPKPEQIYAHSNEYTTYVPLDELDWKELYESYYEEYMALSHDDKIEAKDTVGFYRSVSLLGRENLDQFVFNMKIGVKTPKTLEMFTKQLLDCEAEASYDVTVGEAADYIFYKISSDGDSLFLDSTNSRVEINAQIYNGDGKLVGSVSAITGVESIARKKAQALVGALQENRGEYSSDNYIVALHINYTENIGSKTEYKYIYIAPVYFADADFVSAIEEYMEKTDSDIAKTDEIYQKIIY